MSNARADYEFINGGMSTPKNMKNQSNNRKEIIFVLSLREDTSKVDCEFNVVLKII